MTTFADTIEAATIAKATVVEPVHKRSYFVAGFIGAIAGTILGGVVGVLLGMLGLPGIGGLIGLAIGTYLAGRRVDAKTGKQWAASFGAVVLAWIVVTVVLVAPLIIFGSQISQILTAE